jgi:hypothetical protein
MLWITPLLVFKYYWFKKPDLVAIISLFESASWQAQPGERERWKRGRDGREREGGRDGREREREREVRPCHTITVLLIPNLWRLICGDQKSRSRVQRVTYPRKGCIVCVYHQSLVFSLLVSLTTILTMIN